MTKWIVFFLLFFLKNNLFSQNSNTPNLTTSSEDLLQRKITFKYKQSDLEEMLHALSSSQNLKISFANNKLKGVFIRPVNFSSARTEIVLNNLLYKTGFDYLLVGRNIVIIESKQMPAQADSLMTVGIKKSSEIISDTIQKKNLNKNSSAPPNLHIYRENTNLSLMPYELRKEIKKIHEKEMEWAKKHAEFLSKSIDAKNDSAEIKSGKESILFNEKKYYLSLKAGMVFPKLKYINSSPYNYINDLQFKENTKPGMILGLSGGIFFRNFMIGTGITNQSFSAKSSMTNYKKKILPPQANGNPKKNDTLHFSFNNKYTIWTVPFELTYLKQYRNFVFGGGLILGLNFVRVKNLKNPYFEQYFQEQSDQNIYKEEHINLLFGSTFEIHTGYRLSNNVALVFSGGYQNFLAPLSINSLYKLNSTSILLDLKLHYFFSSLSNKGKIN